MRIINTTETALEAKSTTAEVYPETSSITHKSYHELAETPVQETDALARLHANIEMLADLTGRLSFVMKEVRYLMKV